MFGDSHKVDFMPAALLKSCNEKHPGYCTRDHAAIKEKVEQAIATLHSIKPPALARITDKWEPGIHAPIVVAIEWSGLPRAAWPQQWDLVTFWRLIKFRLSPKLQVWQLWKPDVQIESIAEITYPAEIRMAEAEAAMEK